MGVETVLIGAAIGAGIGAIGGAVTGGGDKIWKGALTGAVGGAVTGGVGSWATGALGSVAGGALAGGAGGIATGALGTALSGGTGSDYLRNIFTGGVSGAALGGLGGYMRGADQIATPESMGVSATDANYQEALTGQLPTTEAATGLQTGTTAAPTIQTSITGTPGQTAQPSLADTVNAAAGSQSLDSGVVNPSVMTQGIEAPQGAFGTSFDTGASVPSQTVKPTAGFGETSFTYDDYPSQAMINQGTANPMGTQAAADSYQFNLKDIGADVGMDTFGFGKNATTSTGKNMTDFDLKDYLKMQGYGSLLSGGVKALGALATAPETARNRQQLMDLYNQQQEQNQYYGNLLRGTYENPQSYLGLPEAAATRSAALQKALAANAAAGRRTQGGALNSLLMQEQLKNLGAYRAGMPRPNYGTAAQTLNFAQQYSPTADIVGGLASMATPLSLYSLFA